MENSEDLFEELKMKQQDKVCDFSPVEENATQDLFLMADERLNKILHEKSSVRIKIDVENPDEKDLEAVVKSTATKLGYTMLYMESVAVKREVLVELSQNALTEYETETLANE